MLEAEESWEIGVSSGDWMFSPTSAHSLPQLLIRVMGRNTYYDSMTNGGEWSKRANYLHLGGVWENIIACMLATTIAPARTFRRTHEWTTLAGWLGMKVGVYRLGRGTCGLLDHIACEEGSDTFASIRMTGQFICAY